MSGKEVETDLDAGVLHNSEWVHRWQVGNTAFHQPVHAPLFDNFEEKIFEGKKKKVFAPLCGKTLDLIWLYQHGHTVIGVEIAEQPVKEFFDEHSIPVQVEEVDKIGKLYKSQDGLLQLYVADLFDLSVDVCGQFDLIYDCRSLVAINKADRTIYVKLLLSMMKPDGVYYLKTHEYDPAVWPGPPHTMGEPLIRELYADRCNIEVVEKLDRSPTPAPSTDSSAGVDQAQGDTPPPKLSSAGAAISTSSYIYDWWFCLTWK